MRYPLEHWIELLSKYIEDLNANQYSRTIFPLSSEFISKDKTLNMNRRDITDKEEELRRIDTKPSLGDYLILWFFYTKQGYGFNF